MFTTIENQIRKAPKELAAKRGRYVVPYPHQVKITKEEMTIQNAPAISTVLVLIALGFALGLSFTNGQLFFKELMVSSFIIVVLLSFRLMGHESSRN